MIRIDLQADCVEFFMVDDHRCADAAKGFGQDDGCPAVEQPIRLNRALVNGHAPPDKVFADFGEFYAEIVGHGVPAQWLEVCGLQTGVEPDRHGYGLLVFDPATVRASSERTTTSGRNCVTSPPFLRTSRTRVEATDVYCGRQVRKIVSIW